MSTDVLLCSQQKRPRNPSSSVDAGGGWRGSHTTRNLIGNEVSRKGAEAPPSPGVTAGAPLPFATICGPSWGTTGTPSCLSGLGFLHSEAPFPLRARRPQISLISVVRSVHC